VLYDADLITNLEEQHKERAIETERLNLIIEKSFLTESGRQTAREVLMSERK